MVSATLRPLYPLARDLIRLAGWTQGWRILAQTRIHSPERPALSEPLYGLHCSSQCSPYLLHLFMNNLVKAYPGNKFGAYPIQINRYVSLICTTVSQLKTCHFSGETFKSFEVLLFSVSATTTQLLSSGEFCRVRYDTTSVKSASSDVSFYTNNSKKKPNFEL